MPDAAQMVKVDFVDISYGVEARCVGGDVVFEVVSGDGGFVEGDESMPGFRGKSEVKYIGQGKRGYDLNLQLVW